MFHLYSEYQTPNGRRWMLAGISRHFVNIIDIDNGSNIDCAMSVAKNILALKKKSEKSRYKLSVRDGIVTITKLKEVQLHGTNVSIFTYLGVRPVHHVKI